MQRAVDAGAQHGDEMPVRELLALLLCVPANAEQPLLVVEIEPACRAQPNAEDPCGRDELPVVERRQAPHLGVDAAHGDVRHHDGEARDPAV